MSKRENYEGQFAVWHPGQFMAFDLIDDVFENMGSKGRVIARKAQLEADCFLVNLIIKQNKKGSLCKKIPN